MKNLVRDPSRAARQKVEPTRRNVDGNHAALGHEDADEKLLLGLPMRGKDKGYLSWTPVVAGVLLVGALVALWMSMGMNGRELTQLARTKDENPPPTQATEVKKLEPIEKPADTVKENPSRHLSSPSPFRRRLSKRPSNPNPDRTRFKQSNPLRRRPGREASASKWVGLP